ncbi:MAG: hypothetical protein FJX77_06860 [Armatimonadetes bacterium]|nr:hypothetical protein [Armatimonadota bacterium]
MRLTRRGALILTTVFPLCEAEGAQPGQPGGVLWQGWSGGYQWTWSRTNLSVRPPRPLEPWTFREKSQPKPDDLDGLTTLETRISPLSLVGSVVSVRKDEYWDGGAHPSGWISYLSYDADRPEAPLRLTDLFPESDVLRALWADAIVQKALRGAGVKEPPRTAAELEEKLAPLTFTGPRGVEYSFSKKFLSEFSFHHLEGNQVAVRLCAPWGIEVYRFQSTEIGILLPIPASRRTAFQNAARGKEGYLTRNLPPALKGKSAKLVEYSRPRR